jgi:hypothetical protein
VEPAVRELLIEAHLQRSGFTPEQIARFKELRKRYPVIEFVQSQREYNRLAFVKWCFRTGRLTG